MDPGRVESFPTENPEIRPTADRVDGLIGQYPQYDLTPIAFYSAEGDQQIPISERKDFPKNPAYISVLAQLPDGTLVVLTEPRVLSDPNMILRLWRSVVVRDALTKAPSKDDVRMPEVLDVRLMDHPDKGIVVRSVMERYIPAKPVGGVHLADPDALTDGDLARIVRFHARFARVAKRFADDPEFHHRFISNPFVNHMHGVEKNQKNKWWLDFDGRKNDFMRIFGAKDKKAGKEFVERQQRLLEDPATAALIEGQDVVVVGNVIPAIVGKDDEGHLVYRIIERTAKAEYLAFDDATFVVTLASDPKKMELYMGLVFAHHRSREYYEHLRLSVIFDKAGNLMAIEKAAKDAEARGDGAQAEKLWAGFYALKQFVYDALYQTQGSVWDVSRYHLS